MFIIDKALIQSFLKTTERAAYGASLYKGKDNKIVYMPYEATGVLSSLGGIKELLSK